MGWNAWVRVEAPLFEGVGSSPKKHTKMGLAGGTAETKLHRGHRENEDPQGLSDVQFGLG